MRTIFKTLFNHAGSNCLDPINILAIRQNALFVVPNNNIARITITTIITGINPPPSITVKVLLIVHALVFASRPQKARLSYITYIPAINIRIILIATVIAIQGPASTFLFFF